MLSGKTPQDPVNFFEVARVVGARCPVQFPGTAAKMRYRARPATTLRHIGKGLGVMAARRAFQPVKHDQQRLVRTARGAIDQKVHVDEILVRRSPAGARELRLAAFVTGGTQRCPDGLQIATGQPPGRFIVHLGHRCLSTINAALAARQRLPAFRAVCQGWHGGRPCASPARSCDTRWWR